MIGGWPLFTQTLLTDLDPEAHQGRVGRRARPRSSRTSRRTSCPVLLAQPVYQWGYVGVKTIVDKVHSRSDVPTIDRRWSWCA